MSQRSQRFVATVARNGSCSCRGSTRSDRHLQSTHALPSVCAVREWPQRGQVFAIDYYLDQSACH
jgi:hypothetical protein